MEVAAALSTGDVEWSGMEWSSSAVQVADKQTLNAAQLTSGLWTSVCVTASHSKYG